MHSTLNRVYRVIWCKVRLAWVAVSEIASGHGKVQSTTRRVNRTVAGAEQAQAENTRALWDGDHMRLVPLAQHVPMGARRSLVQRLERALPAIDTPRTLLASAIASGTAMAAPPAPNQLPTGGQVSAGQASISQSGANMVIQQGSDRAAINWQTFNVGSNAQVQFNQPSASSVVLNRVMSSDPSQIFGRITANGQVILSNPAGVYFAPSARVDVGSLLATTHSISDDDFMAGNNRFERNGSTGSIVNEGELKASLGGYIALLAPEVRNQGAVIAQMGTVALASGEAVDLKFDSNNRLTSLRVEPSQIQALVDNQHAVQAPGGLIIISAQSLDRLVGGVVKNSGAIEATGLQSEGGRIVLSASTKVESSGSLNVSSSTGVGGSVSLQGEQIELKDGSRIDATGATGGGTVLVGGNWQGSADPLLQATGQPTQAATTVTMASGATIDASATQQGDGGKVVLWSDIQNPGTTTTFAGTIVARGGAQGGNGGQVETSGYTLNTEGGWVNAGAAQGQGGLWLLDPNDTTITQTVANGYRDTLNTGTSVENAVTGSITWNSGVSLAKSAGGDATLTLKAYGDIRFNSGASISSSSNKLNLVMIADSDSAGGGAAYFDGYSSVVNLGTNGGHLWIGGNGYGTANGSTTWNGLTVGTGYANSTGSTSIYEGVHLNRATFTTAGGNAYIAGQNGRYINGESRFGVLLQNGSSISTGAGSLEVKGRLTALQGTLSSYPILYGVSLIGGSTLQTTTGNITITGGENANEVSYSVGGFGVYAENSTIKTTGASGNITITGTTGTDNAGGNLRDGIRLYANGANAATTISTVGGNITLNGTSNVTNNSNSAGIRLQTNQPVNADATNPTVKVVSQTGNVSLTGNQGNNSNLDSRGVHFDGSYYGKIYVGYDGSNAYSGNTTISARSVGTYMAGNYLFLGGTGSLTIQPVATSFSSALTVNSAAFGGMNFGTQHSAITLGKEGNTAGLTISSAITAAGPLKLYGGSVNVDGALTVSAANQNLSIYTNTGDISITKNLSTSGGGIVLWTRYKNTGNAGTINLNGSTVTTGGGSVWMGGGNVATSTWNGLTIGDASAATWSPTTVPLGLTNSSITTSGGSVSLNGLSWYTGAGASTWSHGVLLENASISSGSGSISLNGETRGNYNSGAALEVRAGTSLTSTSGAITLSGTASATVNPSSTVFGVNMHNKVTVSSTSGAIAIYGTSTAKSVYGGGIWIGTTSGTNGNGNQTSGVGNGYNVAIVNNSGTILLDGRMTDTTTTSGWAHATIVITNGSDKQLIKTGSGNLTIKGNANVARADSSGVQFQVGTTTGNISVVSSSGDLYVQGFQQSGSTAAANNALRFSPAAAAGSIRFGASSDAASYTGRMTFEADSIGYYGATTTAGALKAYGSGAISFTSSGASSVKDFTLSTAWDFGAQHSSFAIGKLTETKNITLDADVTAAGSITVYGGDITLRRNLTSTLSQSPISLVARGAIIGDTRLSTLSTNGGDVTLAADSEGNGFGNIDLLYGLKVDTRTIASGTTKSTAATGGGKITMGGGNAQGTGYASGVREDSAEGIRVDKGLTLYSGGGNITLKGQSWVGSVTSGWGAWGVGTWEGDFTADAGQGKIAIEGISRSSGASSYKLGIGVPGALSLRSAYAGAQAITLTGRTTTTASGWNHGVDLGVSETGGAHSIVASGVGGGITIDGAGNEWAVLMRRQTDLITNGGPLNLLGSGNGANLWLRNADSQRWVSANVADYSSFAKNGDLTIRFDSFNFVGRPQIATSGNVVLESYGNSFTYGTASDVINTSWFNWNQNSTVMSSFRLGKSTNTGRGVAIDGSNGSTSNAFVVNGPVTAYGKTVTVSSPLTITGTGDIYLQGFSDQSVSVDVSGVVSKTGGGDATLTMKGAGGVSSSNNITASGTGTGKLNILLWANSDGNTLGGVWTGVGKTYTSNGGHIWIGGSATPNGNVSWNGLTVGNGASVGTYGANYNGLDLRGTFNTGGGDFYAAGKTYVTTANNWDINATSGNIVVNAGSGNVSFVGNRIDFGGVYTAAATTTITTTGTLTIKPYDTSFGYEFNWQGAISSSDWVGTYRATQGSTVTGTQNLTIKNIASLGGLVIGKEGNTSAITVSNPATIAGPISLYGGNISLNDNLSTSNTGAAILAKAAGNINVAASKTIQTSGGNVTLWADSDGSGAGYVQLMGGAQVTTNGGAIVMGGGTNIATGYARGEATRDLDSEPIYTLYISGVHLRSGVTLSSGGGDITLRGQNVGGSNAAMAFGVFGNTSVIDAGAGKIAITGLATGSGDRNAQAISQKNGWTLRSANTTAQAITLFGDASGVSGAGTSLGVNFNGLIEATGTGGGITITGKAGSATSYDHGTDISGSILAKSGPITLNGVNNSAVSGQEWLYLNAGTVLGAKASTNVTTSSSNITLNGDKVTFSGATTSIDTSGTVTVQPYGTSFGNPLTWSTTNVTLANNVSGLTLGKDGNTADITVASATSIDGSIAVYGGNIVINAKLESTATGGTITLKGAGAVTDGASGHVSADNLLLLGGNVTLNHTSNAIGILAASGVGSLTYIDSDALTIGTVGSTNGISASGAVSIGTKTGHLTLAKNITTTDATVNAVVLNAAIDTAAGTSTGGNIVVSGSPTISMGTGGRATLYSGEVDNAALTALVGSGSGRFRYGSDESATNFSTALGAGIHAIYRESPTITLSGVSEEITYGNQPVLGVQAADLINGDSLTLRPTVTVKSGGSTVSRNATGYYDAGNYTLSLDSTATRDALGYSVTYSDASTLKVNQRALTVTVKNDAKFIGQNDTVGYAGVGYSGFAAGEGVAQITTTGLAISRSNASTNTEGAYTGVLEATGLSATNYSITYVNGNYNIVGADKLLVRLADSATMTYAGAAPSLTGLAAASVSYYDIASTSVKSMSWDSASSQWKDGSNTASFGYALSAPDAGVRAVSLTGLTTSAGMPTAAVVTGAVTVTPKALTLSATKTYDGSTSLAGAVTLGGLVGTETLNYSNALASDKNVLTASKYVSAITLTDGSNGGKASNYELPALTAYSVGVNAVTINARPLSVSAQRVYNGSADMASSLLLGNLAAGEDLTVSAALANSAHVLAGKYFSTLTLTNGAVGLLSNYSLPSLSAASDRNSVSITPAQLTASLSNTGVSKTYDGSTSAPSGFTPTWSLSGLVDGDTDATLTYSTATYNDKSVAAANTLTLSSLSLGTITGGNTSLASDYALSSNTASVAAAITARTINVATGATPTKVYDGTTEGAGATVSMATATSTTGKVGNEDVSIAASGGSFTTAGAGTGKSYTLDVTLNGADAANYVLGSASMSGSNGIISQRLLTLSATKVYDGTTTLDSVTIGNYAPGEYLNYSGATLNNAHVAGANRVSAITLANVVDGSNAVIYSTANYQLPSLTASSASNTASVTPAPLTIVLNDALVSKVYDGTANGPSAYTPSYTLTGFVSGDTSAVVNATKAFNSKNVADANTFTLSSLSLGAIETTKSSVAGDYALSANTLSTAGSISARQVTIDLSQPVGKTYDGTATVSGAINLTLSGVVSGETLGVSASGGAFDSKNAGTGLSYTFTGLTLSGATAANYVLASGDSVSGINGVISPKALWVSGLSASGKTYDGATTASTYSGTAALLSTTTLNANDNGKAFDVDDVALSGSVTSASFNSKDVLAANRVNFAGLTLTGADAGNYELDAYVAATITAKTVTATPVIASRAYDGTTTATVSSLGALTGLVGNEKLTLGGTATASFADANAGENKTVTVSGITLANGTGGGLASNYVLAPVSASASITPKVLSLSASKSYDGSTSLTGYVTITGLVGSETLTYSGATASSSHVATPNKYISAITLADGTNGGKASNYQLPTLSSANAPVTINALTLTASLTNSSVSKTYDGTTNAPTSFTPTWSISGLLTGDTAATVTYASAAYNSKDVASANKITLTGLGIGTISGTNGSLASDYTLSVSSPDVAATITKAPLTIYANSDAKFVTTVADPTFTVSYAGFVNGETASALATAPTVAADRTSSLSYTPPGGSATTSTLAAGGSEAAGTYVNALVASGAVAGNYAFTYVKGDLTVVPSGQLLVRVTPVSNTYGTATTYVVSEAKYMTGGNSIVDLTSSKTASGTNNNTITLTDGASGTASFTIAPLSASYSTANQLKVGSYQLSATDITETSANFSNTITVVGAHQVNAKSLSLALSSAPSKTYDGTTSMSGVTLSVTGLEGDKVSASGNGAFNSKNVGTGLGYTISNLALSGDDKSNYYLSSGTSYSGTNGTITAKAISVKANTITAAGKVYDGNTSVTLNADAVDFEGKISGDILGVSGATGAFADKNVGTDKTVNISGITLGGLDAGNYTLSSNTATTTATITRLASVTWTGGASGNWFDPANWAGGAVPDLSNVANVVIPQGVTVNFNTAGAVSPADATQAVNVNSIGSDGSLTQANGTLNIGAGGMTLDSYTQSGGTLTNAGATTLRSFDQSGGTFSGTGNITVADLNQTGGSLSGGGKLTVTDDFNQSGTGSITIDGNVNITDVSGGVQLGNLQAGGNLTVDSTDGAITQANGTAIVVNGTTDLTATNGNGTFYDITLNGANNDFKGTVTAEGDDITLVDKNSLTLGDIDAAGKLDAKAGVNLVINGDVNADSLTLEATTGNISEGTNGTLTVDTGPTNLIAGGDITLNKANDFNGTVNAQGGNITLNDTNDLTLGNITATGKLDVTAADNLVLDGNVKANSLDMEATNGSITQNSGSLEVLTGPTDLVAQGDIKLDGANNDFNGTVDAEGRNITIKDKNDLTLGDVTATGDLNVTAGKDIALNGDISAGKLDVTSTDGSITQGSNGSIDVSGDATLIAKKDVTLNGDITAKTMDVTATDGTIAFNGDVTADTLKAKAGDDITQGADSTLTIEKDATLTAKNDVALSGDITAKTLDVTATDGSIAFNGDVTADTLKAKAGDDITQGANSTLTIENDATLTAKNDVTLNGDISAKTLDVTATDGSIAFNGDVTADSLTADAGKDITQGQNSALTIKDDATLTAQGDIALDSPTNDFQGKVNADATNIALSDKNDLLLGDITTRKDANGNGGNFSAEAGAGGSGGLTQSPDSVLDVAGNASLIAKGDITLDGANNDFKGLVNAEGGNIALVDINSLTLGNVTAGGDVQLASAGALDLGTLKANGKLQADSGGGNITQTGPLQVGGLTDLNAGAGRVDLLNPGNRLSQGATVTASAVVVVGDARKGSAEAVSKILRTTPVQTAPGTGLSNANAPQPLVMASSSSASGSSATETAGGSVNSTGVVVDMRNAPTAEAAIMAAVSLPKGASTTGTGFSFELPQSVRAMAQGSDQAQASLPDGAPLPDWLKFDAANLRFEATAVPNAAFPIQLMVMMGGQRVLVVISERTE